MRGPAPRLPATSIHLRHPPRIKPPQRLQLRRGGGRKIGLARRFAPAEPAQQIGADRRQQFVAVESAARLQRIDQIERARRSVHHRHRGGVIELDHRRRADPQQHLIEAGDLRPVGVAIARRPRMQRGDRGLHRIGFRPARHPQRLFHQLQAFGDLRTIPQRAILLFQQHDVAACGLAPGAARVVQQHQRQQSLDLAALRHQRVEQAAKPDRFAREIRAASDPRPMSRHSLR